ncbi:MAG: hypothetical protein ACRYGI_02560 [Janthinobacterium lividum]
MRRKVRKMRVDGACKRATNAWIVPGLLLFGSVAGAAWLELAPRPDRPLVAIFPPWWWTSRAIDAVTRADGNLVGLGRWPNMVVTRSSTPNFGHRLHRAGAWLLIDARSLAGCMTRS